MRLPSFVLAYPVAICARTRLDQQGVLLLLLSGAFGIVYLGIRWEAALKAAVQVFPVGNTRVVFGTMTNVRGLTKTTSTTTEKKMVSRLTGK